MSHLCPLNALLRRGAFAAAVLAGYAAAQDPPPASAPPVSTAPAADGADPQPASAPALRTEWLRLAADYSFATGGLALWIQQGQQVLLEQYAPERNAADAFPLAEATAAFWGPLAAAMLDDGLLRLNEPVMDTIHEWRPDDRLGRTSIRELLQMIGGHDPGDSLAQRNIPERFAYAVRLPALAEPGRPFRPGPGASYIFGALVQRKTSQDPVEFLSERILDALDVRVGAWRRDRAGNPDMAAGAEFSAPDWARFGELLRDEGSFRGRRVINPDSLRGCFRGSRTNPAYGLGFWINTPTLPEHSLAAAEDGPAQRLARRADPQGRVQISRAAPEDLIVAAGADRQRLYVSRSLELVVVRLGGGGPQFDDDEFFHRLLRGQSPPDEPVRGRRANAPASGPSSTAAEAEHEADAPDAGRGPARPPGA